MNHPFPNGTKTWFIIPGTWWICVYPVWRILLLCLRDLRVNFVHLSMNGTKNQQLSLNVNVFMFCSILWRKDIGVVIMKLQLLHDNNKMLIGGQKWRKQITTPIIQNSPTNRCGMMDTDDEAAGRLRSTDLHCIIVAALEGHEKKPIHFHALRNKFMCFLCGKSSLWKM